ncbi:MAG TPA: alpha/beta fold hydrolase [Longimicrobiaceae bacterium]|nr:alpha/beta fold hydrolase [Longimicrobiaceae bacterium]
MIQPLAAAALLVLASAAALRAQQPDPETAGFLLMRGVDTVSVERFSRTGGVLEGRILARKRVPITYRAVVDAGATIDRLELQVLQPGAPEEAPPRQRLVALFRGDSIFTQAFSGDSSKAERLGTRSGALPYHPQLPMLSLLEQVVRRARVLGGERVQVPVFLMSSGAQTVLATVEFRGADSARVEIGSIDARLAVDREGRILGGVAQGEQVIERVAVLPGRVFATQPADYSAPAGAPYTAEEVRIETAAGHTLVGTLTIPKNATGRVPAVVTITGSSRQDRDHNTPYGGPYRIFRQVADTLGRRGIAVLRMDDRGVGQSTGDFESATTADRADDIRAGLAYLRGRQDIDGRRLGLVGLSEGGAIAPMIAATDPALDGIVLLAAPASTGRQILEYQGRYNIEQKEAIRPEQRDSVYRSELAKVEARLHEEPWLRFFLSYDPLQTARRVRQVPVLILHGTTDRNVPPADAQRLAEAFRRAGNRDVTVRMFEDMNHIFLRDPDGNPSKYESLPSFEVAPEVLGTIADWTAAHLKR